MEIRIKHTRYRDAAVGVLRTEYAVSIDNLPPAKFISGVYEGDNNYRHAAAMYIAGALAVRDTMSSHIAYSAAKETLKRLANQHGKEHEITM